MKYWTKIILITTKIFIVRICVKFKTAKVLFEKTFNCLTEQDIQSNFKVYANKNLCQNPDRYFKQSIFMKIKCIYKKWLYIRK